MKRSLYWFLSISTRAISTLVNLFLWAIGTSSSSSDFSFFPDFSDSSFDAFKSSSRSWTFCCSFALTAWRDFISSLKISCSLRERRMLKEKSSKVLDPYPVNSSTLAIKSSLTMLRAFFVASSSLFSVIKFSTSFPIPEKDFKCYVSAQKTRWVPKKVITFW